jgi:hypothetical protein
VPILVLALLLLAGAVPWRAAAAEAGELIDRVWSGHPVGFSMLAERGHLFIAYYDANRRITVIGRRLGEREWQRCQPEGVEVPRRKRMSNVTAWDSHNYLRLALDRDGHLHLSGNMHVDPLVYYRSRRAFDVTSLERLDRMTGEREERCTYPVFFQNAAGDLLFRYRDGSSGNGSDLYNIYDPATRTWRRLVATPLLEGEGRRNAYSLVPTLGPDGRFHLVWVWRNTPDCATNHTLSYARSRDLVQWENSRGEPIALPMVLATGEVIDAAKPGEGLINTTFTLGFDDHARPVVVYHRYDAKGHSQAYAARPAAGSGWQVRQISNWDFTWAFSGGGSIQTEVSLGAPRREAAGILAVDYSTRAAGSGRWRLDAETLAPLGTASSGRNRPAAPPTDEGRRKRGSVEPGMEGQSLSARADGRRWLLRWQTLGRNRDKPREAVPPPSELRLFEAVDKEPEAPARR